MVEDDDNDAVLIRRELMQLTPAPIVHHVRTQPAFAAALGDFGPHAILCDHNIPGFGGPDALELAQRTLPDVPFILVTGSLDEEMRGTETILVVEDEAPVRAVTTKLLERNGYTVLEAADGAAALALVDGAGKGAQVDLLLTDVIMPGMSGRELADHLKARRPSLRVLFMSGYTDDAVIRHGMLERGLAYIEKPFRPPALLRQVREVLQTAS